MVYLKALFFNFLIVFFANYLLSGIEVVSQSKLPHIGGDLIFALVLGFLNSLNFPILKLIDRRQSPLRIAMFSLVLNFAAYGVLKLIPVGIHIVSVEGYIFVSLVVAIGSFLTNFFEMKHFQGKQHKPTEPPIV